VNEWNLRRRGVWRQPRSSARATRRPIGAPRGGDEKGPRIALLYRLRAIGIRYAIRFCAGVWLPAAHLHGLAYLRYVGGVIRSFAPNG